MKQVSFFILAVLGTTAFFGCKQAASSGPQKTSNGYVYEIQEHGKGEKPKPGDFVFFDVLAYADDSLLYNSYEQLDKPRVEILADTSLNYVKEPVQEILAKSVVGDSILLLIPKDSIKAQMPPNMKQFKTLRQVIAVKRIVSADTYKKEEEERRAQMQKDQQAEKEVAAAELPKVEGAVKNFLADYNSGKMKDKLKKTDSGLEYYMMEDGTGNQPKAGDVVKVHYYGVLKNGTLFDNSLSRGLAFDFPVGRAQVIKGWDEGITLFREGGKGFIVVPYQLAYGEAGSPPTIPAKTDLVFYINVLKIVK